MDNSNIKDKNSSKKFDNYVYMSICEITLELFKKTNYITYKAYCNSIKDGLNKNIEFSSYGDIVAICKRIDEIYSLDWELSGLYISNYFCDEKYLGFEKPVKLIQECFPVSFN